MEFGDNSSIAKVDGMTGQRYPAYSPDGTLALDYNLVVHTDGTIFALEYDKENWEAESVIGIDPTTGTKKFSVRLEMPAESGTLAHPAS